MKPADSAKLIRVVKLLTCPSRLWSKSEETLAGRVRGDVAQVEGGVEAVALCGSDSDVFSGCEEDTGGVKPLAGSPYRRRKMIKSNN